MTDSLSDLNQTSEVSSGWKSLSRGDYLLAALVALFCFLTEQILQVRIGLNLPGEGFLWYGVQRVLAGEVPVRDFQAYEPGRYYLLAAWAYLVHSDGIVAMRYGLAILQFAALYPALLLALRVLPSKWLLPGFGILLSLWIAPRHKIVDVAATMWMLYMLAILAARADRKSYTWAGVVAAAMWFIGLNHALYGAVGLAIVMIAIACSEKLPWRAIFARIKWVAAGVVPVVLAVLIWLLVVPHFLIGYWKNAIVRLVESGTTNLTMPIPWPWKVGAPNASWDSLSAYSVSIGFVLFPAAVAIALLILFSPWRIRRMRQYPVALAAAAASLAWLHYAFSRADQPHLVQAGTPMLILLVALPETLTGIGRIGARAVCWFAVVFMSVFAAATLTPAIALCVPNATKYQWMNVQGERLYMPDFSLPDYEAALGVVRTLKPGQTILFVPYDAGLYAVFRLRCPIYESYCLFPASPSEQRELVEDLQKPGLDWAFIWPDRVDGRADLGFEQTDRLGWEYILKNFDFVRTVPEARNVRIYRRKTGASAK